MKNQMINSKKYHFEVDQLKAAINEKHLGLVNSKCITFHQDNTRQHVPLMTRQKLFQSGKFWYICLIHQTLHLWISIYFILYKILLMEKNFNSRHLVLCLKKLKVLGRWNYEVAWKMTDDSGTKWWIFCSVKFLMRMKNVSFIFT